jgi:hypothetical protein
MVQQKMTFEVMEFIVWVVEITAREFFNGDKTAAYDTLKKSGIWDLYIDHYDTTHTLGAEYLLAEIRGYFNKYGVKISC